MEDLKFIQNFKFKQTEVFKVNMEYGQVHFTAYHTKKTT